MRTLALEIDDEVFAKAQAEAVRRGITPEALATKALTDILPSGHRVEFPVFTSKKPGSLKLTNEDIRRMEEEDDLRMLGRLD